MVSIMASKDQSVEELCDSAKEWSRHRGVQEPVACTANYLFPGGWVVGGDNLSLQYILEFGKSKVCFYTTFSFSISYFILPGKKTDILYIIMLEVKIKLRLKFFNPTMLSWTKVLGTVKT